ncbi:hypothetical protein E2320_015235 [Naja naja]|nr:hypothetical protein E2320_015235 [Naja naja]
MKMGYPDIGAEAIEFRGLPKTVQLDESAEPNSVVTTFSVNCTNLTDVPVTSLKNVTPVSSFFNFLNILSAGIYQVRLSPSAALDARVVNLYALTFTANCRGETKDGQLFVQVNETRRLVCNEGYTGIGRLPIQVSEDIGPGETIYTTVLKRRGTGILTKEPCRHLPQVSLVNKLARESSVACTIRENAPPLSNVIQVQASVKPVVYQIISPSTDHFTIEPDTGIIRTTYYLDLKNNPSLAYTQLEVKAYNMLNHADYAIIIVNITVKQENLEGPLCSPAVFVYIFAKKIVIA